MQTALFIGIGGFVGSVLRYGAGELIKRAADAAAFPWHTLAINLAGCLLLGLLNGFFEKHGAALHPDLRAALTIGLCGGFTTFSTFAGENIALLRQGSLLPAFLYMACSLIGGLALFFLAFRLTRGL